MMIDSVPLSTLPLDPDMLQRMDSKGIRTTETLFSLGVLEISETLDIGPRAATHLLELVASALMHANTTTMLDRAMRGGMPCARLTELVGPAGVGKTQLCFTLAVSAALSGTVIYLDVEHKFSAARVYQLAAALLPQLQASPQALQAAMVNIKVVKPTSSSDLLHVLQEMKETVKQGGLQLILLDSIAAAVRSDFGSEQLWQRQCVLGEVASLLKTYAEAANVPVVVTNQITTAIGGAAEHALPTVPPPSNAEGFPSGAAGAPRAHITASLGTVWAHAVSCRLVLEYLPEGSRCLKVVKAPDCPFAALEYRVTAAGLDVLRQAALPLLPTNGWEAGGGSVLGMAISNVVDYGPQ